MSARATIAGGIVLIAALMTGAVALQRLRDRFYTLAVPSEEVLYVTSDRAIGRMSLEFRALNADLYWIRALQYFGGIQRAHREGRRSPEAGPEYGSLNAFLDLTTSLDPLFNIAYRFGAIFLSEPPPAGPGRSDLAIRLLNKGLAARPDKWEYMQDIGFVQYWWNHNYQAASEAFQAASRMPGAPWWLRSLAATTLAQGGDRRSSRLMWLTVRETAEIDWLRNSANRALQQLDALDTLDALQAMIDRFGQRAGRPLTWQGLASAGAPLRRLPIDPAGVPFVITPEGRASLGETSPLLPLPTEPPHASPPS